MNNSTKKRAVSPTSPANLREDRANLNLPASFVPDPSHSTPPNNLQAEQSTLGAMLLDNAVIPLIIEELTTDDFYNSVNRRVWTCATALHGDGQPVDQVTVCEWLRGKDLLEDCGGPQYIVALLESCPSSVNYAAYTGIVRNLSLKRQAAILSRKATDFAMNGVGSDVAVAELRKGLDALEAKTAPKRLTRFTGSQLLSMTLPDPKWVVPGLLPEGFSILAGNPKLGKSWLALGIAIASATGGAVLGSIGVERGDVLYMALEDTDRRLQSRLRKILGEGARDADLSLLDIAIEWPRLDMGGVTKLERWLQEHPNARLVVIDTFQKIRGNGASSNSNAYGADYEAVSALKLLADRYGVAILAVHHRKKGEGMDDLESISGSYGLTGAADGIWSLKRERGRADATLFVTGRDVDEQELALKWDSLIGCWSVMGEASEYRLSQERAEILEALRVSGRPLAPKEMHDMGIGTSYAAVKQTLWQMSKDGQLRNDGGKYAPSSSPPPAVTPALDLPMIGDAPPPSPPSSPSVVPPDETVFDDGDETAPDNYALHAATSSPSFAPPSPPDGVMPESAPPPIRDVPSALYN